MKQQVKVLIVDDEEVVCARLKPALQKDGYYVETFTTSTAARQRLDEDRFDIVVTDLKMPEIDGLELLQIIAERWPDTKVIIISGFATVEATRAAFQSGVHDVIAKPFKIGQLKELIQKLATEAGPSHG